MTRRLRTERMRDRAAFLLPIAAILLAATALTAWHATPAARPDRQPTPYHTAPTRTQETP